MKKLVDLLTGEPTTDDVRQMCGDNINLWRALLIIKQNSMCTDCGKEVKNGLFALLDAKTREPVKLVCTDCFRIKEKENKEHGLVSVRFFDKNLPLDAPKKERAPKKEKQKKLTKKIILSLMDDYLKLNRICGDCQQFTDYILFSVDTREIVKGVCFQCFIKNYRDKLKELGLLTGLQLIDSLIRGKSKKSMEESKNVN